MSDEYYAGKGCNCYARSESECACDADWTDPKVYKLTADNARLCELVKKAKNTTGWDGMPVEIHKVLDELFKIINTGGK